MDAFVWDDRFVTGLAAVDQQHRHLVDMVNRLGDLRVQGAADQAELERMFGDLAQYALYHFAEEERLMAETGVDARHAQPHILHHQEFVQQVTLMWRNRDGAADSQSMLHDFLAAWLTVHILGEDQIMGRAIKRIREGADCAEAHNLEPSAQDSSRSALLDALHNLYKVLSVQNRDLAAAKAQLETKVAERTRELADTNTQLTAEREELRQALRQIEEAQQQLARSEKMASLGRMVAGFAHEINTPIGIAVGAISHEGEKLAEIERLLTQEEVSEDDLRANLGSIREGGDLALANLRRCAELVQRFKRSSVDQASEQQRDFDMAELIEDVRFSLQNQLKRLPIQMLVECPARLKIRGVPGRFEQILTNLILNSIQHGFHDGQRPGTIRISVRRNDDSSLRISFADDGIGMDSEVVDRIFEPFYTTARAQGGSGLGLFLSYNIVTLELGGSIVCESAPGQGCRFQMDIPIANADATEEQES